MLDNFSSSRVSGKLFSDLLHGIKQDGYEIRRGRVLAVLTVESRALRLVTSIIEKNMTVTHRA